MRFVTERKKNKTKQNKTKNNENEAEFIPRAFPSESPSNNDKKLNILCHPHGCCCYDLNTPLPGGYSLIISYIDVLPPTLWFFSRFGLKTGVDFGHFGLKLDIFCLLV